MTKISWPSWVDLQAAINKHSKLEVLAFLNKRSSSDIVISALEGVFDGGK